MREDASSSQSDKKIFITQRRKGAKEEDAEKIALRLVARAEQSSAGLARKLERRGCDLSSVEEVISRLTEQDLINDSRFARLWLQSRLRLTRTPKRLLAGLCSRGIPRNEAEAALDEVLDEEIEFAMLERFAKKHAKKAARKGEEALAGMKYLLKGEGFSKQAIEKFILSL